MRSATLGNFEEHKSIERWDRNIVLKVQVSAEALMPVLG
jgi:hypothetical protein